MREDIQFDAQGTTIKGWLYLPDQGNRHPLVVLAHGWAATKEMYLDDYAKIFSRAGIAALVFDHRNFGASEGLPRQEMDPWAQVNDYRHAISYAIGLSQIDEDRIGVWGTSYSGGHAIVLGAIDRRVKCVVSQCPTISGWRNALRRFPGDTLPAMKKRFQDDRLARFRGAPPVMVPILPDLHIADSGSENVKDYAGAVGNDGGIWFSTMPPRRRAAWRNEITLRTLELYSEYEPGSYIERVSPTPLLMITADADTLVGTDEVLAAYARALEPKRLLILPGGHYDLYGMQRTAGAMAARDWFIEHLGLTQELRLQTSAIDSFMSTESECT
jgi:fermentation-respiration switch protein FrsA (DUF1100 family)